MFSFYDFPHVTWSPLLLSCSMISALLGEEGGVFHWLLFFFATILILLLKWKYCYQIYNPKTVIKEIDLAII